MTVQSMDVTNKRVYKFTEQDFGNAVYISAKQNNFTTTIIGEWKNQIVNRTCSVEKTWGICVNKKTYVNHGKLSDPSWLLSLDSNESYCAITQEYYDAYKKDKHYLFCYEKKETKQDLLTTLKNGEFHLIVRSDENVLYDLNGEVILRRIFVDYINGYLTENYYFMEELTNYLKNHPQCQEVERKTVPYYNAEFEGETALEFYYVPKDLEEFKDIIGSGINRMEKIKNILGVEKYKKKEEN